MQTKASDDVINPNIYCSGYFFWKRVNKSKTSLGLKYAGTREKWLLVPLVQSVTNVYCMLNRCLSQLSAVEVNYNE
jgi:hypothetical protein